jgi:3-deoxy-D-manno-octulosonic-acid transferase
VLWFHALSVGESLALRPLIDRALANDEAATVVLTTATITSVVALEKAGLPDRAVHVLLPIDTVQAVRRFLDHWRPTVAVFAELDFWPRLMFETHRRHIPMILVNSRMSAASFASRGKRRGMMRDILGLFDRLLIQDPESFERFKLLGADPARMSVAGVLKAAARPLSADQSEIVELKASIGDRPIWLAAATCDVEEPAMIAAHRRIIENWPNALLIIAPRFPDSADAIEAAARSIFQNVARRSRKELPDAQTNVYRADTLGEMGLWYRLAPVSFVGHSLGPSGKPLGGKNPYEAAA